MISMPRNSFIQMNKLKYGEKLSGMRLVEEKEHQTSKEFIMSKRRAEQDSLTVEEVVNILKNE